MGPLELIDLIGIDVTIVALESTTFVEDDPRIRPAAGLRGVPRPGDSAARAARAFTPTLEGFSMAYPTDPQTAADPATAWTALISRYYNGCSAGDVQLILQTLHPDVIHWFLAPNVGSQAVAGAEHLARYWRKVTNRVHGRWVVEKICATADQAVIEWSMWWLPEGATERVVTRGAEWFVGQDGLIREIRSYYQMLPRRTELDGFPYSARGYSVNGAESSALHPSANAYGSGEK